MFTSLAFRDAIQWVGYVGAKSHKQQLDVTPGALHSPVALWSTPICEIAGNFLKISSVEKWHVYNTLLRILSWEVAIWSW
jgi:hypothetical protein